MPPKKKDSKSDANSATESVSGSGQNQSEPFYVGVGNYKPLRRKILEAEKNALIMLQAFQKNVIMKEQRMMLEAELKKAIQDLTKGIADFENTLPRMPEKFRQQKKQESEEKQPKKEKPLSEALGVTSKYKVPEIGKEKMQQFDSELDRIRGNLENIDEKLRNLEHM